MAYKLVCIHEFHDHHSAEVVKRGQEIHDYEHMALLVESDREHHFVKVALTMADAQWDWPPRVGVKAPAVEPVAEEKKSEGKKAK